MRIYRRKLPDGTEYGAYQYTVYDHGVPIRGTTEKYDPGEAKTFVKILEGKLSEGNPLPRNVRFSTLLEAVIQDYEENDRRSISDAKARIDKHIDPFFGNMKVGDITAESLRRYRRKRTSAGAANGTINRELSIIGKAFTLSGMSYRPRIEKLAEKHIRQGFINRIQLKSIKSHLPAEIADLVEFLFLTGWRRGEAFNLEWKDIDFDEGFVTLEAFTTKNDEPRAFPMYAELRSLLLSRREETDRIEREKSIKIPWVFHRNGQRILDIRKSWEIACKAAGVSATLVHDLRRSAIKIFTERGISEQHGMKLAGHKTPSIYRRYNIVTRDDLKVAVSKLESLPQEKDTKKDTMSIFEGKLVGDKSL